MVGSATQKVNITTAKDVAGTYAVTVEGLSGKSVVKVALPLAPPKSVNWWLIGGIVVAVAVASSVIYLSIRIRREV